MESTMMIADEQQQENDQPDPLMVLGEDFPAPAVVNVDVSENLQAAHISPDKKTLFGSQWEYRIAPYGHLSIPVQAAA